MPAVIKEFTFRKTTAAESLSYGVFCCLRLFSALKRTLIDSSEGDSRSIVALGRTATVLGETGECQSEFLNLQLGIVKG